MSELQRSSFEFRPKDHYLVKQRKKDVQKAVERCPRKECNLFFFFWWDWGLNTGLHAWKVSTLLLEPHLQSILRWGGSHKLVAQAGIELQSS
jgi:hypothetical protein